MKKLRKVLVLLLVLLLSLSVIVACGETPTPDTPEKPDDSKPTPTPTDYVEIASVADLLEAAQKIASNTDGYATKTLKLTADITLTDDFVPITGFKGVLDGQFHKISGLTVDAASAHVGLFATLDGAEVRTLVIAGADVANSTPVSYVGILAGSAKNAKIDSVTVDGTVTVGGTAVVGGLVGLSENSVITNVVSTATVTGNGSIVGGVVGKLSDGAVIVNAYVAKAPVVEGATVGTAAGEKDETTAVAYVLAAEDGSFVGTVNGPAYLPSYVIACKVGVDKKGEMGWNSADWDVTGAAPALKANADKKHNTPSVTIDEKSATAVFGKALTLPALSADEDGVAHLGYTLNGELWFAGLPVMNDVALESYKVGYADLAGEWKSLSAGKGPVTVGQDVTFDGKTYTRVFITEEKIGDYTSAVIWLKDEAGALYTLKLSSDFFKGETNALLIALAPESGNATYFIPGMDALAGAWKSGNDTLVFGSAMSDVNGMNQSPVLDSTLGTSSMNTVPYFSVVGEYLTAGTYGYVLTPAADGNFVLTNGTKTYEIDLGALEGTWTAADGSTLVIADGKIGDKTLAAAFTENGSGAHVTGADGKDIYVIATTTGIAVVTEDGTKLYSKNNFGGTYAMLKDGTQTTLRIDGADVYVNGATEAVKATVSVADGIMTLHVTVNGTEYAFVKSGDALVDETKDARFCDPAVIEKFYGNYVLGTVKAVLAGGKVTFGTAEAQNLTLNYADGAYTMTAGELTFAFDGDDDLTVTGYNSPVTKNADTRKLFTQAEITVFLGSLKEYMSAGSLSEKANVFAVKNGILTVNGVAIDYEITKYKGALSFIFRYDTQFLGNAVVTVTPNGFFANVSGEAWGTLLATELYDGFGSYYDMLTGGLDEDDPQPNGFSLTKYGTLTVNGKSYTVNDYEITVVAGKLVITVKDADVTVTLNGDKTATVGGKTYYNVDRVMNKNTYVVTGSTTDDKVEVINGSLGYMEEDDEDEWWEEPVYPLFGLRYTVGGVVYTSETYTWARNEDGTMTLSVVAKDAAGNEKSFSLTYTYEGMADSAVLTVDGTSQTVYGSSGKLGAATGTYTDGTNTVVIDKNAGFTLNGERKAYTSEFDFEGGVYSFIVDGKTYTFRTERPEILKCGGKTLYDARLADFAGVKLVAYTPSPIDDIQKKYRLELTPDGLTFNGELVTWQNYSTFSFAVSMEGYDEPVVWQANNSQYSEAVGNFGIRIYPKEWLDIDAYPSIGWAVRCFVPELLWDNAGDYAAEVKGMVTFFRIKKPYMADTSSYVPFTFSVGATTYTMSQYTFHMEGETLVVETYDGKNKIEITPSEGATVIKLNGAEKGEYEFGSLSRFVTGKQLAFGFAGEIDTISLQPDGKGGYVWTYAEDAGTWTKKTGTADDVSFGKWNGDDIVSITANSRTFTLAIIDSQVWVISGPLFDLANTTYTDENGNTVSFRFAVVTEGSGDDATKKLTLKAVVNVPATEKDPKGKTVEVNVSSGWANYDEKTNSSIYARYTYSGKDYVVCKNCDAETNTDHPYVLMDYNSFTLGGKVSIGSYSTKDYVFLQYYPVYDAETGMGKMRELFGAQYSDQSFKLESFNKDEGSDYLYTLIYVDNADTSKVYTYKIAIIPGATPTKAVKVLKAAEVPYLGTHTVDEKTVTVSLGKDENGDMQWFVTMDGKTYVGNMAYKASDLKFTVDDKIYILSISGETKSLGFVLAAQYRFLGDAYYANAQPYYKNKATVKLVGGVYKVELNYVTYDAVFAADNTYLYFTANDGVTYRIYYLESAKACAMVEASKAAFLGTHGDIFGELTAGSSSASFTLKYKGNEAGNVKTISMTELSFEIGEKVHVVSVDGEGNVTVTENVMDLGSDENKANMELKGNYSSDKSETIVIDYRIAKNAEGKYVGAFYATYGSKEATFGTGKKLLIITSEGTVHYYFKAGASDLLTVTAAQYAMLGEYTQDGHTVLVEASSSYNSWRETYTLSITYNVDGTKASPSSVMATGGESLMKLTVSGDVFLYYASGDTKILRKLTAEEAAQVGLSAYRTIDGKTLYLKGSVTVSEGTFTFGYTFGESKTPAAVTLEKQDGVDAYKIGTYNDTVFYALMSGSKAYIVTAAEYAMYGEFTTKDGKTLKFTWGTAQLMVSMKKADGTFGTAVEAKAASDGTHDYYTFTIDSVSYILAKDTAGAWVLTDATNIGAGLKHYQNFVYGTTSVVDMTGKAVYAKFSGAYKIGDDGVPVYVFFLTDSENNVIVVSEYEEMNGGEVFKMTVDGQTRYFAVCTSYGPADSWFYKVYKMLELTEAQAKMVGQSAMVGDNVFTVIAEKANPTIQVYVGTTDKPFVSTSTKAQATFSEDGKTITFTYGGTTYTGTVGDDGKLVITANA